VSIELREEFDMAQTVTFEAVPYATLKEHLANLQAINSVCSAGERIATIVLSKSPEELSQILTSKGADQEALDKMIEVLIETETSLKGRLKLVETAFARIAVVSGVLATVRKSTSRKAASGRRPRKRRARS
jgi:hypothetical protein